MVAPNTERRIGAAPCPECGHSIKISSAGRSKRVQCPKCRAVVELFDAPAPAGRSPEQVEAPAAEREPAVVPSLLARVEALEAHVRRLETQLHEARAETKSAITPAAEPPPSAEPEPATSVKLRWVPPTMRSATADAFAAEAEDALLHNLKTFPSRSIKLATPVGDEAAQARAERLKKIFEQAHWAVQGPREFAPLGPRRGLWLFVGALPASRNAAATYFAFTASGFNLCSMMDPAVAGDEAMLFVA